MDNENMMLAINQILSRGNTAEIKKRKGEIIVLEVSRKIKQTVFTNG